MQEELSKRYARCADCLEQNLICSHRFNSELEAQFPTGSGRPVVMPWQSGCRGSASAIGVMPEIRQVVS
jgi:hypothetical protein